MPKFGIEKEVRVCDSCYAALQSGRQIRSGDEVFFDGGVACLNNIQKIFLELFLYVHKSV